MTKALFSIACGFKIELDDYIVLNKARMKLKVGRGKGVYGRLAILAVLAVFAIVGIAHLTGDRLVDIAPPILIGGAVGGFIVYRYFAVLMARLHYRSFRVDKTEQEVQLSDDGYGVKTAKFSGLFPWDGFVEIQRTARHFLFWVNPMQAHILPFRVLKGDEIEQVWGQVKHLPVAYEVMVK